MVNRSSSACNKKNTAAALATAVLGNELTGPVRIQQAKLF